MTDYDSEFNKITEKVLKSGEKPSLLLHSCCAPCSSYCLERVTPFFSVTVFFCNPNITGEEEYLKRLSEQKKFVFEVYGDAVKVAEGKYDPENFLNLVKGRENDKERGERCTLCYNLRLEETAKKALEENFEYFATTLTLSPYKDAERLNKIGENLQEKYGVNYLFSDFKKHGGYSRSIELSKIYGLYRQNYCGCVFSKRRDL